MQFYLKKKKRKNFGKRIIFLKKKLLINELFPSSSILLETLFSFYESLEPIGSKAPALIGEMKRGWKETIARSSVVLTCPGQGHPVPSFR